MQIDFERAFEANSFQPEKHKINEILMKFGDDIRKIRLKFNQCGKFQTFAIFLAFIIMVMR